MWRAQHAVLLNYLDEVGGAEHLRVVRHEDVCLNPIDHFSSLYDWAGLPWTREVEATIEELTSSRNPTERSENTDPHQHRHRRDSSTVVDVWKRRLTKEQIRKLRTVTEPVASEFYDEETWH